MKSRTFGSSIWLVAIGAATVLLIGAFARFDSNRTEGLPATPNPEDAKTSATTTALTGAATDDSDTPASATNGYAPKLPSDLSPGLAEVVKLAQAHVADDVMLAFIQNSGLTYAPTSDELLYLADLGVSDKVIGALYQKPDGAAAPTGGALASVATPPALPAASSAAMTPQDSMIDPPAIMEEPPPLQNPQDSYFYDSLAPYGSWVQVGEEGWGWQPVVAANPGWMPYRNRGHWDFTDEGLYWASDYSWGWAAFHYGRWLFEDGVGWVWVPGNTWAPAWVAWRNTTDGFAGWAALPPRVGLSPGLGLVAARGRPGFTSGFGLGASAFTFVSLANFQSINLSRFAVPSSQVATVFKASTPVNNYAVTGQKIVVGGVTAKQIATVTKVPVRIFALHEAPSLDAVGGKPGGQSLNVFRPKAAAPAKRASISPPVEPVHINRAVRASPAMPSQSGFTSENFRPAIRANPTPPGMSPAPRSSDPALAEVRPIAASTFRVPATAAPSLSTARSLNSGSVIAATRNQPQSVAPVLATVQRPEPAPAAPAYNAARYSPPPSQPAYSPPQHAASSAPAASTSSKPYGK